MAIRRGWTAYCRSRYQEARSRFEGLLGSGTDPLEAVWGLSAVMRAQGCPAEAAQLIQRARRDHASEPSLDREAGYIAYEQRRFGEAARIFAALAARDPDNSITDRRWQAASLRMVKEYEQAQEKLDEARTIGDHPDLDLERGWLAYVQCHYHDAATHFRAAGVNGAEPEHFVPPARGDTAPPGSGRCGRRDGRGRAVDLAHRRGPGRHPGPQGMSQERHQAPV